MSCPHCGADVMAGYTFCQRCRKRVLPPGTPPPAAPDAAATPYRSPQMSGRRRSVGGASFTRPGTVTLLAVLDLIGGAACLLAAFGTVIGMVGSAEADALTFAVIFVVYGLLAAVYLGAGIGLLQLKSYGRTLQIGLSVIGLLGVPCGTLISIAILMYLFKPGVKIIFSGRSPDSLTPQEQEDVEKIGGSNLVLIIILILLVVVVIGIVAAIAIPSLLRARVSANESGAIGDTRTMISSQTAYQSVNGGYYDTLECLMAPQGCLPDYPATSPIFLDSTFAAPTRRGYTFRLHLRPPESAPDPAASSPSSAGGFAYVAVPATEGRTGVRSFCGDETGRVCSTTTGTLQLWDGGCPPPPACQDLY